MALEGISVMVKDSSRLFNPFVQVDIHILTNPQAGKWVYQGTEVTDANGRVTYHIPDEKRLPEGMYPLKMVVR